MRRDDPRVRGLRVQPLGEAGLDPALSDWGLPARHLDWLETL